MKFQKYLIKDSKDWHKEWQEYMKDPLYANVLSSVGDPKLLKKNADILKSIRGKQAVINVANLIKKAQGK